MKKKILDLENGYKLVVEGNYKEIYNYPETILETWSLNYGCSKIYIRKDYSKKEEMLIRSGDILNILGVFRSAHIYENTLTKDQFKKLVKRNYFIEKLNKKILDKIDKVWLDTIEWLKGVELDLESNEEFIKYKEPTLCFNI